MNILRRDRYCSLNYFSFYSCNQPAIISHGKYQSLLDVLHAKRSYQNWQALNVILCHHIFSWFQAPLQQKHRKAVTIQIPKSSYYSLYMYKRLMCLLQVKAFLLFPCNFPREKYLVHFFSYLLCHTTPEAQTVLDSVL